MFYQQDIYNPYQNFQSLKAQQQNFPQQSYQQPQHTPFKVMPVTSIDEAKAAIAPPDTILIFPDFAKGKIYTKQLNLANGTAIFNEFSLVQPAPVEYAPLQDLNTLKQEVDAIKAILSENKAVK